MDHHFPQYALFAQADGTTLEVVEPSPGFADFQNVTIVCFTVDDLDVALGELAALQQAPISPVISDRSGWGWTYLRMPHGAIYQLQGRVAEHGGQAVRP